MAKIGNIYIALGKQSKGLGQVWAEDENSAWYRIVGIDRDHTLLRVKPHDEQRGWFITRNWEYRPYVQDAA